MKLLIALLSFLVISGPASAQQSINAQQQREINIARKLINDKRVTAIAYNMSFTQKEKEKFWPLYREYRKAMAEVGDKRLAVIMEYADHTDSMTENKAKSLLDRMFAVEKETIKVKQRYVGKFRRILPQTKVVRLMQLEHRMNAQVELKIAEGVPLME